MERKAVVADDARLHGSIPRPGAAFSCFMSFFITHRDESNEDDPPLERLWDLLAELAIKDDEHPEVSLEHESGWSLDVYGPGYIIWYNPEAVVEGKTMVGGKYADGRHMRGVSDDKIIELWTKLARGDIDSIEAEPWKLGYR